MKRTILPIGALIVCATISLSVLNTGCQKNSISDPQDADDPSVGRTVNSEFTCSNL